MSCVIVVEGALDRILISRCLREDPRLSGQFSIVVAGGQSSAVSLARSHLAAGDARIVLLLDSDTIDPDKVASQRSMVSELLEAVSPPSRFRVVLAVPEIEVVLFADRKVAHVLFGRSLSSAEWAEAQVRPKVILGKLIQGTPTKIINLSKVEHLLADKDLAPLLRVPLLKEIGQFILAAAASETDS